MKKSDELKREITAKKNLLEKLEKEKNYTDALKVADELSELLDELKIEQAKEKAEFDNFLQHAEPISGNPINGKPSRKYSAGVVGEDYEKNFFNSLRHSFTIGNNLLKESINTKGGYLVPTSFGSEILSKLENENIMRQICTVIQTDTNTELKLVSTPPQASWISEGATIPTTSEDFSQITLGAFKLGGCTQVSNELLQDSFYDLPAHLANEFGKALAAKEEESFIVGNGTTQPEGILTGIDAANITTSSDTVTADALINLSYSLERQYRRNASWLMSDATFAEVLQLKDPDGRFLVQNALVAGEPPQLLGRPVYTSPYLPTTTISNQAYVDLVFGDFKTGYYIAERGARIIKALPELFAMSDLTGFIMLERIDGRVIDQNAFKVLRFQI